MEKTSSQLVNGLFCPMQFCSFGEQTLNCVDGWTVKFEITSGKAIFGKLQKLSVSECTSLRIKHASALSLREHEQLILIFASFIQHPSLCWLLK